MFYIIDQWGKKIREYHTREDAEQFMATWRGGRVDIVAED